MRSPDPVVNFTGTFLEAFRLASNSTLCFLTTFILLLGSCYTKMRCRHTGISVDLGGPTNYKRAYSYVNSVHLHRIEDLALRVPGGHLHFNLLSILLSLLDEFRNMMEIVAAFFEVRIVRVGIVVPQLRHQI